MRLAILTAADGHRRQFFYFKVHSSAKELFLAHLFFFFAELNVRIFSLLADNRRKL